MTTDAPSSLIRNTKMYRTYRTATIGVAILMTSAGLVPGIDYRDALRAIEPHDLAILSRSAVNERGYFLDDLSLDELRAGMPGADIRAGDHVTDVLLEWG